MSESTGLVQIIEAALLAAGKPLSVAQLSALFEERERPANEDIRASLEDVRERCDGRGYELVDVASGFRFQVREHMSPWISRLWQERPQKYSRALLETLALVAYRQPITRGEIEEIRGVAVSTNIIRTLHEREWIRVVGHRDVPGRPSMYATTRDFLDYFSLKSLDQLPTLADIRDLETLNAELGFSEPLPEAANAEHRNQQEGVSPSQEHADDETDVGPSDGVDTENVAANDVEAEVAATGSAETDSGATDNTETGTAEARSVEADDGVSMTSQENSVPPEDSLEEWESNTSEQVTHGKG
ncbi:MAG: segregation and condensation protein B [Glaciecola sp.]|jgi:segregation and condensation protein B|uniref:SMC-Scp complex subunit ScpB n=1 Tax=Congregibacter sp. TaxID=2744308 RepID=UPI0039E503BE